MFVYYVYVLCTYKYTHIYSIYLENMLMYLHVYIYINIIYIIYESISYINTTFLLNIYMHVGVFIYT